LIHSPNLRASKVLQEELSNHPEVEVKLGTTVKQFHGDGKLSSVTLQNVATGKTEVITPGGVFIFIGLTPNTGFAKNFVDLDQWGFIKASKTMETCAQAAPSRWRPQLGKALPPP
jgi:thioredoxin reductase (NADPH)